MEKKSLLDLGWKSICLKECYSPYDHSHDFILAREIEEGCPKCDHENKSDAQIYGTVFGRHEAHFYNSYYCDKCKHPYTKTLYKGVPRSLKEIYEITLKTLNLNLNP